MKQRYKRPARSKRGLIEAMESRTLLSGGLDPTFGTGGYVVGPAQPATVEFSGTDAVRESDGKLLVSGIGGDSQIQVRRYLSNGQVDATFGANGVANLGTAQQSTTFIAVTSTGNIVVADGSAVYQMTAGGVLDLSFGTRGTANVSPLTAASLAVEGTQILVGGYIGSYLGGTPTQTQAELIRLNPNGAMDSTFGANGIATVTNTSATTESFSSLFVTAQGNILVGLTTPFQYGTSQDDFNSSYEFSASGIQAKRFASFGAAGGIVVGVQPDGSLLDDFGGALVRLTPTGALDASFPQLDYSGGNSAQFTVEPDGSFLLGLNFSAPQNQYAVTRYSAAGVAVKTSVPIPEYSRSGSESATIVANPDGSYFVVGGNFFIEKLATNGYEDTTYGFGGEAAPITPAAPPAIYTTAAVQTDHKVIVGGLAFNGLREVFDLTRYDANGSIDDSFGTDGVAQTMVGFSDVQSISLLIEPTGQIIAAGNVGIGPVTGFAMVRYNTNGAIDTTFGTKGIVVFNGDQDPVVEYQAGKLLVGTAYTVRRFNADGSLDKTFATGLPAGTALAIQPDGKIVVGTEVNQYRSSSTFFNRFNANGTKDLTFGQHGTVAGGVNEDPSQITVEPNGTIVALETPGGYMDSGNSELEAYNPNGTVDAGFGSAGVTLLKSVITDVPSVGGANSLLRAANGQLYVTQSTGIDFGDPQPPGTYVSRYTASGTLDTTFGTAGTATLISSVPLEGANVAGYGALAALDADGRLYLAGGSLGQAPDLAAVDTNNNTGTITGYMFYDTNGNGVRDPGEGPLNWTCYIDVDNDGFFDNADIRIYTDSAGNFVIPNLAPGVYHIRQSQVAHWQKTTPAEFTVTVAAGETVTGIAFGSRPLPGG